MPDIDVDFEHSKRELVLNYVAEKYGAENVCHIVTFGTLGAKTAIRDVARALGYPPEVGARLAKMVPAGPKVSLHDALETPDLEQAYATNPQAKQIIDIALRLEGCKRHSSQHACGFIVAPSKVSNWLPTSMEKDENGEKALTAQVTMSEAEKLGLLKMDFLGLKNMTVLHDVIENIKRTRGITTDYHDISTEDRATYQMLAKGMTGGSFQLESPGMTGVVMQMLSDVDELPPERLHECFERMIAAVALYRPGPMAYIGDYVDGMRNPERIHYDAPQLEGILKSTYGVIVYQEQVMQIAQTLAGYSLGEADLIRKAVGKKIPELLNAEHDRFVFGNKSDFDAGKAKHLIPGCVGNGIEEIVAEAIWQKIVAFASYAFNRSHAACYAYIAVLTAYMACHWTPEFFSAMCNAFIENSDKLRSYLGEVSKRGVAILPPDINLSEAGFSAISDTQLRFGLRGIKGVSSIADDIVTERNAHGPFAGVQDFYKRMLDCGHAVSKDSVESLIAAGAFSFVTTNKKALMLQFEAIASQSVWERKHLMEGQCSMFGEAEQQIPLPTGVSTSERQSLDMEHEYTGLYITGHPVDVLRSSLSADKRLVDIMDLHLHPNIKVAIVGVVGAPERRFTKKGEVMYNLTLSDRFGTVKCVLFPSAVPGNEHRVLEGNIVKAVGKFVPNEDYGNQFIVNELIAESEIVVQKPPVLCVTITNAAQQALLLDYVAKNPGNIVVVIKAGDRVYKPNLRIALGQRQLDYLQSTFPAVATA